MNFLLRTEASVAIGSGHVMRCLALAQAFKDAGEFASFAMSQTTPAVEQRLRGEGFEIMRVAAQVGSAADAGETATLAGRASASWVVVDGYEFGAEYQASLRSRGLKVLFIDDNGHAAHYPAEIVLNQNAHASEALYRSRGLSTRVLLGPRYALLRREFTAWREWKRGIQANAGNVLVTMGGSDPEDFTSKAVEGLRGAGSGVRIRVLVGGSNPHAAALERLRTAGENSIQVIKDATDMPKQMSWADVAVAAAGSTCLEMCLMGLPALLIDLAENQTPIAKELARRGTAYYLGNLKTVTTSQIGAETRRLLKSAAERSAMSQRARELVDGQGAERVVRELLIS